MLTKKPPEHSLKYLFSQPIHQTGSNNKHINEKLVSGNLQTEERVTFTKHIICNREFSLLHRGKVLLCPLSLIGLKGWI